MFFFMSVWSQKLLEKGPKSSILLRNCRVDNFKAFRPSEENDLNISDT